MESRKYDHKAIEKKWQKRWLDDGVFAATASKKNRFVLDMFPYPSGDGLHVGHPIGYIATDIYSRYLRMKGESVLHPMGWDAFGLPTENAAIKKGVHPREVTKNNIANFKRQITSLGFSYDWDREINTTDPKYYRWTQWIFLQLFKQGLAYEAELPIWWCPKDKTGLANEEVVDGACERCGTKVERKMLRQWVLKITKYADRLLDGLDKLDWPEGIKALQRNWIGKSEGAQIKFTLRGITDQADNKHAVEVYTTRPDTLFGATFLVISPELGQQWLNIGWKASDAVKNYIQSALTKSEVDRQDEGKEKTGVDSGIKAVNPATGEEIPVWVADYVLGGYGTGAIMAVPGHDVRDFEFAKKFQLPIVQVIRPSTNAIVVHGCPDSEEARDPQKRTYNKHWLPWIRTELLNKGIHTETPLMPTPWAPVYSEWKKVFEKLPLDENTVLIGHSCGSSFLVRWLDETKKRIGQLILVAPWKDMNHENQTKKDFYTFTINKTIKDRVDNIVIFTSDTEDEEGKVFAQNFHNQLGGEIIELHDHGHFTFRDMGTEQFPELLNTITTPNKVYSGDGISINSATFSGMKSEEARKKITAKFGKAKVQYKLRDWIFSRQRYWGEPIPLVHCAHCKTVVESTPHHIELKSRDEWDAWVNEPQTIDNPVMAKAVSTDTKHKNHYVKVTLGTTVGYWRVRKVTKNSLTVKHVLPGIILVPEEELPLELPNVEKYEPTGTGESPLAAIDEWVNVTCRVCGHPAKRETNTMPQWAGSCWYYLRFTDPDNDKEFASAKAMKAWLPVSTYVGGAEHAVLHLLYARFWHKVLFDIGAILKEVGDEPFAKLKNQGLILGPDGEKMSKSRGNVINPDDIIEQYGADTLRMYEMFMGPFEDAKPWDTNGIVGVRRFLEKVWRASERVDDSIPQVRWHKYSKKITEGIEHFRFNTCVSDLMKWTNDFGTGSVAKDEFGMFLKLLSPFAPHIAEELWQQLGYKTLLANEVWPKFDPKKVKEETVTIAVQVMGKLRATLSLAAGSSQASVEAAAKAEPNVAKFLTSKPKKVIFIKDKLINFVV